MGLLAPRAPRYPAVSFDRMGERVGGPVVGQSREVQQRDYDSDEKLYWSKRGKKVTVSRDPDTGEELNPVMQLVVAVQAARPKGDDEGIRAIFIKSGLLKATREAAAEAGIEDISEDTVAEFYATWVDEIPPPPGQRGKPTKVYEVELVPAKPKPKGVLADTRDDDDRGAQDDDLQDRTREAVARIGRAQENNARNREAMGSRLATGGRAGRRRDDDEPPF